MFDMSGALNDTELVELWLYGKSANAQRAYRRIADLFRQFLHSRTKVLSQATLRDLQQFDQQLEREHKQVNSRNQYMAGVKSLLTFATSQGYLEHNVGTGFKLAKADDTLFERSVSAEEIQLMLKAAASNYRNYMLLWLMYETGGRANEIRELDWRDFAETPDGVIVHLLGKGNKVRDIPLPTEDWEKLKEYRGSAHRDEPVFKNRYGRRIGYVAIWKIVKQVAKESGVGTRVSPHFFRHAHASHSLAAGCPIDVLQANLGHANLSTTGRYLHATGERSSAKYLKGHE